MKKFVRILIRALIIAVIASAIGLSVNFISPKGIPLIYVRPQEKVIAGVKVPLVDAKTAYGHFKEVTTKFVDTRTEEEFEEAHVKGAICLPTEEITEMYPEVQPLLERDALLILYCHGPDCDLAEQAAEFLAQLGYKKMLIMVSGFPAWKAAGYPVEGDQADR